MTQRAEPPDLRDWSRLPNRVRPGGGLELVTFCIVAGSVAVGAISIGVAIAAIGCMIIALVLLFDSRRPWRPVEPTVTYDPLAAHAVRWAVVGVALIVVGFLLTAVGMR